MLLETKLLIQILKMLAAQDPMLSLGNGDTLCKYCGAFFAFYSKPTEHKPDCIWVESNALLETISTKP